MPLRYRLSEIIMKTPLLFSSSSASTAPEKIGIFGSDDESSNKTNTGDEECQSFISNTSSTIPQIPNSSGNVSVSSGISVANNSTNNNNVILSTVATRIAALEKSCKQSKIGGYLIRPSNRNNNNTARQHRRNSSGSLWSENITNGTRILLAIVTGIIVANLLSMSSDTHQNHANVNGMTAQELQGIDNINYQQNPDGSYPEMPELLNEDGYRMSPEELQLIQQQAEQDDANFLKNLGERMRLWRAKKQLDNGYFYSSSSIGNDIVKVPMKPYSITELMNTLPHFTRELLLVQYSAVTDEFVVMLPGIQGSNPICDMGCTKITNIMQGIIYAFRNRYSHKFGISFGDQSTTNNEKKDLMFLVSTADTPRLSKECYNRAGYCMRRKNFAPILHFGSGYRDSTILPSLVVMPPPPGLHLRCMMEWQRNHEICEFLESKKMVTSDGRESQGLIFGEHINYAPGKKFKSNNTTIDDDESDNTTDDTNDTIGWRDLKNQIIWRGSDIPYMTLLNPEMRVPDYTTDVESKLKGDSNGGVDEVIKAMYTVYDDLRLRWKAVLISSKSEYDASERYNNQVLLNPNNQESILPWANMKFTSDSGDSSNDYQQWTNLGLNVLGNEMSMLEYAKYKYHIDLGGSSGTSVSETIQKLALPGLLFHVESSAIDWYTEHLVPWVHYIPIKEDLSDLQDQYDWAEKHDRKAREIAKAGTEFVRRYGRPEGMDELYRGHFLKPLEDIMESFQPYDEIPEELLGADGSQLVLKEIMRCKGYDVSECVLLE